MKNRVISILYILIEGLENRFTGRTNRRFCRRIFSISDPINLDEGDLKMNKWHVRLVTYRLIYTSRSHIDGLCLKLLVIIGDPRRTALRRLSVDPLKYYQIKLKRLILVTCSFNRLVKADWNWFQTRWSTCLQSQTKQTLGSPRIPKARRDPLVMKVKRFRRRFNSRTRRFRYSRSFSGRHVSYRQWKSL